MDDALDVICDLIEQALGYTPTTAFDSGFITAYANAMRYLADHGRFKIISDDGGRYVYGEVIWP